MVLLFNLRPIFVMCGVEDDQSVRQNKEQSTCAALNWLEYLNFECLSKMRCPFESAVLRVTREMCTSNFEYCFFTIFDTSHPKKKFINVYIISGTANFRVGLLTFSTAGGRQGWPSDCFVIARIALHCALHMSRASLRFGDGKTHLNTQKHRPISCNSTRHAPTHSHNDNLKTPNVQRQHKIPLATTFFRVCNSAWWRGYCEAQIGPQSP